MYCRRCGYRSHTKMHNLAKPCIPADQDISSAGKANINRINKGLLPYNLIAWPDENVYDHITTQVCGDVSFRTVEQMTGFAESYNLVLYEETHGAAASSSNVQQEHHAIMPVVHPARDMDIDTDSLSSD